MTLQRAAGVPGAPASSTAGTRLACGSGTPTTCSACTTSLRAHGLAIRALRAARTGGARVGSALVVNHYVPATPSPADLQAARGLALRGSGKDPCALTTWLDPMIRGRYPEDMLRDWKDQLPCRHSTPTWRPSPSRTTSSASTCTTGRRCGPARRAAPEIVPPAVGNPITAFDWDVVPSIAYYTPRFVHERYQLPIVITENGALGTGLGRRSTGGCTIPRGSTTSPGTCWRYTAAIADGHPRRGLLPVVPARQLRVGPRVRAPLRPVPRRLRDAGADREGLGALLPRRHPDQREEAVRARGHVPVSWGRPTVLSAGAAQRPRSRRAPARASGAA